MAITNNDRVKKGLDLLYEGLLPYIERELSAIYGKHWYTKAFEGYRYELPKQEGSDTPHIDIAAIVWLMWDRWNDVFSKRLGYAERSYISELRIARNKWAHDEPFSSRDAERMLDTTERLLTAVGATPQAETADQMRKELLRLTVDEQARNERRKKGGTGQLGGGSTLTPWREIVTPHPDVASGRYQQAEFAADLWQVHLGEGSSEYRDPIEFFRRTYLTESLSLLLRNAMRRLTSNSGDPVVQLQTNFGGGKTHSMLALYHLFSGIAPTSLPGIEELMQAEGTSSLPTAKRVVLVGNKISPGNPHRKPDGTLVRTLWGELAWQLGGADAYEQVRLDDENATNPGDRLRDLFNQYAPCIILIDEWVAYARQLHDQSDLPAGSFETQFSFAQALTESAKLADRCLLVISLPASDTSGAVHSPINDVEVGGQRGREALDRLRNVVGRLESSWRPASAEEGFEIVRRRLFEPLSDPQKFTQRDVVARAFAELYRREQSEFPRECRERSYEERIKQAYPIHPEVFDRLYTDWSTLVKFQRTRGVLRLMAAVIYDLWQSGDRNPLIMPATIPIDEERVRSELTRYLADNWQPIIEKDVDGDGSLPTEIDASVSNLGKYGAARRVARTIFLGSAPTVGAANRGIGDPRIKLGCTMPGESPSIFGDALRRLTRRATYLYEDGSRYWYDTQPTVTRLAEDRAEQIKRTPDKLTQELAARLRQDAHRAGKFLRVHPLPATTSEVPDDPRAGLVLLGLEHPHIRGTAESTAMRTARSFLEQRGNSPRMLRNTLVFLAAEQNRIAELQAALATYLAWKSILSEKDTLNLTPSQANQAETQCKEAERTVKDRIPETYRFLLVPVQEHPKGVMEWRVIQLPTGGDDSLAERASHKLLSEELLVTRLAGTMLRREMDKVPLWQHPAEHVPIKQLVDYFTSYVYLPRLQSPQVLITAIQEGIASAAWEQEAFAYAESYNPDTLRYEGLQVGCSVGVTAESRALLVQPTAARRQLDAERPSVTPPPITPPPPPDATDPNPPITPPPPPPVGRRFYGSVTLDPQRVSRDAATIADELIQHLTSVAGAQVRVRLEIEADLPNGLGEHTKRTVSENARQLKFTSFAFEEQ